MKLLPLLAGTSCTLLSTLLPGRAQNHSQVFFDASGTDQGGFGGNQIITISGNLTYYGRRDVKPAGPNIGTVVEDFVQPASDVYIVRHGFYLGGGAPNLHLPLQDVDLVPNTILGAGGGGFFEQTIATTAPQGLLMSGEYDLVVDEHQNGYFEPPLDLYLGGKGNAPAITVEAPVGVPLLPNPGILAMKSAGQAQYNVTALLNSAFRVIEIAYDKIAEDNVKVELKEVFKTIKKEFKKDPDDDAPFKLGFTAARNALANKMKQGLGLVADPPDPDFAMPVELAPALQAAETDMIPLFAAAGAFANALDREARLEAALLSSLEKYQGAKEAGHGRWALAHARGVAHYAKVLAAEITRNEPVWTAMKTAATGSGFDFDALLAQTRTLQTRLRTSGFSATEMQAAASLGLSTAELEEARNRYVGQNIPGSGAAWIAALDAKIAAAGSSSTGLIQLSTEMNAIVIALLALPSIDRDDPVVAIGGPFNGTAGAPLALSASATDFHGREIEFAWDIDGDGEFDDATGATPPVTIPAARTGFAGVKATNAGGRSAAAYTALTVTSTNQPPVFTSASPSGAGLTVEAGITVNFSANASDPDGGPAPELRWTVDGKTAATGGDFTFAPSAAHQGLREVSVTATDSAGARRTRVWAVLVTKTTPLADLALTMEAPENPVQTGAEFTWTMTVQNNGPSACPDVVLTHTLPPGLFIVRASASFGTATSSGSEVKATLGTIAPGGVVNVWVQTTAAAPGTYSSAASVTGSAADLLPENNNASARVRVNAPSPLSANLSLSSSVAPASATLGNTQTITLTTANAGPDAASGLMVETQLPESVDFVSSTPAASSSADGLVQIALPGIAGGASGVATIVVRPALAGSAPAEARVLGAEPDPDYSNNESSALVSAFTVPPPASDLTVSQTPPAAPVRIGKPATWTITVTNNGPAAAANVTLLDRWPAGAEWSGAKPAAASLGNGQAAFLLGALANGATRTVEVTVEPQFAGEAVNLASVTSDSTDANGATSSSTVTVQAPPSTNANLAASLIASASSAPLNTNVTFTLTISNGGPDAASSVVARTKLPAGLTFVSATGGATHANGVVTLSAASLANGANVEISIVGKITTAYPLAVISSVASADNDPDEANNQASVRVLGTDPAASVAIIRNLEDPEIPKLQEYLSELGMTAQVFDDEGLTFATLSPFRLIIWNDLSYAAFGVRVPLIQVFQAAATAGKPMFFIGDDLAYVTLYAAIPEPEATQWTQLIHLQPTLLNIGVGGQTILSTAHAVTNGFAGVVGDSGYAWDPDNTVATGLPGETVLARSGPADSLIAFRDPVTRRKSVTQNELIYNRVADEAGAGERRKLFKNAVVWLLTEDQPADVTVSQTAPGSVTLGDPATIRVTITNNGPGTTSGVQLKDTLPAILTFGSAKSSQGVVTHANGVITASLGSLAPGESARLELVLTAASLGAAQHVVNVTASEEEPAPADNSSALPVTVVPVAPAILKATYDFEDTLAACEPGAPPLTAIDPQNGDSFADAAVAGETHRVYRWNGSPAAGQTAGLLLNAAPLLTGDSYSVEMLFRFTEGAGSVRRLVDASDRASADGLSLNAADKLQAAALDAGADSATAIIFHHVVLTVADNGTVTTWLDGIKQQEHDSAPSLMLTPAKRLVFFAPNTSGNGNAEYADGEIALLRVYQGVLPANRAAAQAAFPFGPSVPMSVLTDLSMVRNPSTVWSYGYSTTRGTPFLFDTLYTFNGGNGIETWHATGGGPYVTRNLHDYAVNYATIVHPPDVLNLDPSFDGRNPVLRWTAPAGGLYRVQGRFQGIDVAPNGTDVAVLRNGSTDTTLFEDYVAGYQMRKPFDVTVMLAAGETVDFSVGIGGNSPLYDSTGLDALITPLMLTDECGSGTDIAITQVFSPATAIPGETVECILTVTNAGERPSPQVTVSDTLPPGLALTGRDAGGAPVVTAGDVITTQLGAMAPGETRIVRLLLRGDTPGVFTNAVRVSGSTFDESPANNQSSASVTVGAVVPLAVTVRPQADTVFVNEEVTFGITAVNTGAASAAGVIMTATLPANAAFVSATDGGTRSGKLVTFPARTFAAGEAKTVQVRIRPGAPGIAELHAVAAGPAGSSVRGAEADGAVTVLPPEELPELHIAISTNPAIPVAGCRVTCTFTVTNASATPSANTQFRAVVPAGLVFISASASSGSVQYSGGFLSGNIGFVSLANPVAVTLSAVATSAEAVVIGADVQGGRAPADLLHRWSFSGAAGDVADGTVVPDDLGTANGVLRGAGAVTTAEGLKLPGGSPDSAAYVDLPNGLVSSQKECTIEGWASVNSNSGPWSCLFSFGSNSPGGSAGELPGLGDTNGGNGEALDYILVAANVGGDYSRHRVTIRNADPVNAGEYLIDPPAPGNFGQQYHFAVTLDNTTPGTTRVRYYRDGSYLGEINAPFNLSDLNDVNNWIGRMVWTDYSNLAATYDEFRLHRCALTAAEVEASRLNGPDLNSAAGLLPGEVVSSATAFIRRNVQASPGGFPCGVPVSLDIFKAPEQQSYRLQWTATPGGLYRMQYTDDPLYWRNVPSVLPAAAALENWIDPGPPSTQPSPAAEPRRFYRLFEVSQ